MYQYIKRLLTHDAKAGVRYCAIKLNEDWQDPNLHYLMAFAHYKANEFGACRAHMELVRQFGNPDAGVLAAIGSAEQNMGNLDSAQEWFTSALEKDPNHAGALAAAALNAVQLGDPQRAHELADRCLAQQPEFNDALTAKGGAYLLTGDYGLAWDYYDSYIGKSRFRPMRKYPQMPLWDGGPVDNLVLVGEQGIGDEIVFASCIPDLMEGCPAKRIIFDAWSRLTPMYKRSMRFLGLEIYPSRHETYPEWSGTLNGSTAQMLVGSLHRIFRRHKADFPGRPFLKPDPVRLRQWVNEFAGRPTIGIAWTGGSMVTGRKRRSFRLEDLAPLIVQHPEVRWVSVEYQDCEREVEEFNRTRGDLHVERYPMAAQAQDMDEVAALLAAMDLVITASNSTVDVAGAIGVPCWSFIPRVPHMRYGLEGTTLPWYDSVKLYRFDSWADISTVGGDLDAYLANLHRRGPASASVGERAGSLDRMEVEHPGQHHNAQPGPASAQAHGSDRVHLQQIPGAVSPGLSGGTGAISGRGHALPGGHDRPVQPVRGESRVRSIAPPPLRASFYDALQPGQVQGPNASSDRDQQASDAHLGAR